MMNIANVAPSHMTGDQLKSNFRGGNFSLERFIKDQGDNIPRETFELLNDREIFEKLQQAIRDINVDMHRWLWGDSEPTEEDCLEIVSLGSDEDFKLEAENAEKHIFSIVTGDIPYMAFSDKMLAVSEDDEMANWYEKLEECFFDTLLDTISTGSRELEREYDFDLYDEFITYMAKALEEMAPNRGFKVIYQLTTGENEVSTAECRKFNEYEDDWFDKTFEFNSVPELIRYLIEQFIKNDMEDIISDLDEAQIKAKMLEFAREHIGYEWSNCAPAVAAIAYAAL